MFLRSLAAICSRTVVAKRYPLSEVATKYNTNLAALSTRFSTLRGFHDDANNQSNKNRINWKPFERNFYKPLDIIHPKQDIDDFLNKHKITVNGPAPPPILSFDEICFPDYLANELKKKDFPTPTPIQSQSWPIALSGQNLVGVAQTGSGKTLGYILPAIVHINNQEPLKRDEGPIALVLAPTRELAQQIQQVTNEFGTPSNVRNACVFGGAGKYPQADALRRGR